MKIYLSNSETACAFGDGIRTSFINMYTANDVQNHLGKYIKEFKSKTRPKRDSKLKKVKEDVLNSAMMLLKGRQRFLKYLKAEYF